jgi:threonyl-tRNA synthetase
MKISSENSTSVLNQTAALLLAAAVIELFPKTLLVDGRGTSKYFYYDFIFSFEFKFEFLLLIEERMRLIMRQKRSVRQIEMMPTNAALFMNHCHQPIVADRLTQIQQATVPMVQMGDFTLCCPQPISDELFIPFFKILEGFSCEVFSSKPFRIVGAASLDKKMLKKIAKQPSISSQSHLQLASEMALCAPMEETGLWYWRPKGDKLRQVLVKLWQEEVMKQNFELITTSMSFFKDRGERSFCQSHCEYFLRFGTSKIAEMAWIPNEHFNDPSLGLFSPKTFFGDRMHIFCSDEKLLEECISSLRFILKIPKILGFEFEIVLSVSSADPQKTNAKGVTLFKQVLKTCGLAYTLEKEYRKAFLASIDIRFADSLGRKWTGPFLSMPRVESNLGPKFGPKLVSSLAMTLKKKTTLALSAFGSLERICALLLEKKEGWIPLWLAPQQVRILTATRKTSSYAKEVYESLSTQGIRVTLESVEEKLKARIYRAMVEKVPYVILLGEQEEKAGILTICAYGKSEWQRLSLDEFCMRLNREIESGISELKN